MNGVLVIDKPAGPTSFDVVQRVRRLAGARKAGHAGTLDPAATGVLAVCLGDAVKLQHWLADADKAYEATIAFGVATDTEDAQGRVVETGDPSALCADAVRAALRRFEGEIEQVPPMYSAVRVGGRRLHRAARAGEEVERAPRRVRIHALRLLAFSAVPEDVEARVSVRCGKGTYVRTLAADLGRALGVPAHLASLRRTEASGFRIEDALSLEEAERLAAEGPEPLLRKVIPLGQALRFLPAIHLDATAAVALAHGRALSPGTFPSPVLRPVPEEAREEARWKAAIASPERGAEPAARTVLEDAATAAASVLPERGVSEESAGEERARTAVPRTAVPEEKATTAARAVTEENATVPGATATTARFVSDGPGRREPARTEARGTGAEALVRALGPDGTLVAVCAPRATGLWPIRVFVTPGQAGGGANPGPKR